MRAEVQQQGGSSEGPERWPVRAEPAEPQRLQHAPDPGHARDAHHACPTCHADLPAAGAASEQEWPHDSLGTGQVCVRVSDSASCRAFSLQAPSAWRPELCLVSLGAPRSVLLVSSPTMPQLGTMLSPASSQTPPSSQAAARVASHSGSAGLPQVRVVAPPSLPSVTQPAAPAPALPPMPTGTQIRMPAAGAQAKGGPQVRGTGCTGGLLRPVASPGRGQGPAPLLLLMAFITTAQLMLRVRWLSCELCLHVGSRNCGKFSDVPQFVTSGTWCMEVGCERGL